MGAITAMGKEFELKYQAGPDVLQAIREKFGEFTPIHMETHYYDNPAGELGALRWTLRRRLENGVSICGLKTPGDNEIRGEWEVEDGDIASGVRKLCAMDVPEDFAGYAEKGLVEVCGARFTRLSRLVDTGSSRVEIALDQGVFLGAGKEQPFSEVEVELKSGTREDAEAFGGLLAEQYGLTEGTVSKYERALALAKEGHHG